MHKLWWWIHLVRGLPPYSAGYLDCVRTVKKMSKEIRVVYRNRQYIKPVKRINMVKVLAFVAFIAASSILGMYTWLYMLTSWSVSERDTTVASISEVSTRTATLEHSLGLTETAWVGPLSVAKAQLIDKIEALEKSFDEFETIDRKELTDLESTINATRDTFLLHRDYHPFFSDDTLLIVRAISAYETVRWVDDQNAAIAQLGMQVRLINDEQLSIVYEEVMLGEVSSEWLWIRLQYLFWTSLNKDY